jgi:ribosomal protein S1
MNSTKNTEPRFDNEWWEEFEQNDHRIKKQRKKLTGEALILYDMIQGISVNSPAAGQVVKGVYTGVSGQDHLFHVPGFKDSVRVEAKPSEIKYLLNLELGDEMDVLIVSTEKKVYEIKGTIAGLYESKAHQELLELEDDAIVSATVISLLPGGYGMEITQNKVKLQAFMPNTLAGINKLSNPESIVGEKMEVMIETFSEIDGTYIVNRKKYLNTLIESELDLLMTNTPYVGKVTGTTPFGIFVEFASSQDRVPCLTGMIHKVNVVEEDQDRLSDITPGTLIEFYVKEVIKGNNIILTQLLRDSLWDTIHPKMIITGKVRDIKPFGVLVNLDDETVGLIHESEVEKSKMTFTKNQEVVVKVLAADRMNRKIYLTPNMK